MGRNHCDIMFFCYFIIEIIRTYDIIIINPENYSKYNEFLNEFLAGP